MNKEERHDAIIEQVLLYGRVQVTELADHLGVSAVTVRKDLTELEKAGRLYRSHGHAIKMTGAGGLINEKERLMPSQKTLIGQAAAELIMRNDVIMLASGTTINTFAQCIKPVGHLRVVSASLAASETLAGNPDIEVLQLGGIVCKASQSVVGDAAITQVRDFACSKLFLGVEGVDVDFGITTTDVREAALNRAMIAAADMVVVLADHTKFNHRSFSKIADMDRVDILITDVDPPAAVRARLQQKGIQIIIAMHRIL